MILVEAGKRSDQGFDAKLLLAAQLAARGYRVVLDEETAPEAMSRRQRYDAAPYLARVEDLPLSHILVIGAEETADETVLRLRSVAGSAQVALIGRFADYQAQLGVRARLAYALGREPELVDMPRASDGMAFGFVPIADPVPPPGLPRVCAVLPGEWLEQPGALATLAGIDAFPGFRFAVVTTSRGKDFVRASRHAGLAVFSYADLALGSLADRADVAVFFGETPGGDLSAAFAAACIGAGKPVIDGTAGGAMRSSGAPVLRGPEDPAALPGFLQAAVLPNLAALGDEARTAPWTAERSLAALEARLGLTPPPPPEPRDGRVLFLPTNGMGLGHAQRCALIADAMGGTPAGFAAFPSCVPMLQARGYPCIPLVARSDEHVEEYANDVLNYIRLRRSLGPCDHLVFDGGYIFESIHRAIVESGCRATWIRRGLWRASHNATAPTERETAFSRVIVPAEAFAELNDPAVSPVPVSKVGPIVRQDPGPDPAETRKRLAKTLGTDFDTLVVSMLGSGASMDRSAQLQAMAGLLATCPGLLHLIVAWPTSRIPPGLMAWPNTRVVRSRDALPLARAADLVVTAAGYNSFHEVLYHRIPAIFVPQVAPILDDQERRARAAADRGLAEIVMPHEIMTLDRTLAAFLDAGRGEDLRTALAALDLPAPGNVQAARLIEGDVP